MVFNNPKPKGLGYGKSQDFGLDLTAMPPTPTLNNVTVCHSDPPTGVEESNFKLSINFNFTGNYFKNLSKFVHTTKMDFGFY